MTLQAKLAACLAFLLTGSWGHAESVYTWIDAAGVTHFSDAPPADTNLTPGLVVVPPAPAWGPPGDDFYSVIRQAERMQAQRLQREQATAERLRAEAEADWARAQALAAQQTVTPLVVESFGYPYTYYPHRRHRHPGHEPERRPPHRPEQHRRGFLSEMPFPEGVRLPSNVRRYPAPENHRPGRY